MSEKQLEAVHLVPLDALEPAPDNPRTSMAELEDLAASIREHGVLEPLIVRRQGAGLQIVCGERRWRAAGLAELTHVPCLIRAISERDRQELMLVENLQRRSLTYLEEAHALQRMLNLGWTQRELAERIGKSQTYVNRRLLVLTLPKRVQGAIATKKISVDEALGYTSGGPRDIFEADEQLSDAWRALRQEILDSNDRVLIGLLRDFARAYQVRQRVARQPVPAEEAV